MLKGERCRLAEGFERWIPVLGKHGSMIKFRDHHLRGRAGTGKIYPCDSKSLATRGGRRAVMWGRKQITTQVSSYVAEEIKKGRGGKSECVWETRSGRMIRETICEGGSHASHWKRKHARQRDDITCEGPEAGKSSLQDLPTG